MKDDGEFGYFLGLMSREELIQEMLFLRRFIEDHGNYVTVRGQKTLRKTFRQLRCSHSLRKVTGNAIYCAICDALLESREERTWVLDDR